jgi:4-carboxymuconolactone decarboxylase
MARLEPITTRDQLAPGDQPVADAVVRSRGAIHGPFTMLLHCPKLAAHFVTLGGYVRFEGSLDMRVRVLAAMTVARELDAVYVWGAQTGAARRQGVPDETIAAIRERHYRGLPPEDAQIVEFTRELIRTHRVDDASAEALRARFGDEQFIELVGTIGYYSALAMVVNACELEAAPGAEVLQA